MAQQPPPAPLSDAIFSKFFASGLNIPFEDLIGWELIGAGRTAKVYKSGLYGSKVAVKVPRSQTKLQQDPSYMQTNFLAFLKEGIILKTIQHENVCRFMGVCLRPTQSGMMKIMLVLEYLEGRTLQDIIVAREQLSLHQRLLMSRQIIKGMIYVHQSGITHHDLKPVNVILDRHNVLKIVDFGLAEKQPRNMLTQSTPRGSPLWMAPEVLLNQGSSDKSDVYSWGLILWQLLTFEPEPFPQYNRQPYEEGLSVLRQNVGLGGERPPIPNMGLDRVTSILHMCWAADTNLRPSFSELDAMFDDILREAEIADEDKRIDSIIFDEHGRIFWRKYFLKESTVAWADFGRNFFDFLQRPLPDEVPPIYSNASLPAEPSDEELHRASPAALEEYNQTSASSFWRVYTELKRRDDAGSLRALKMIVLGQKSAVTIESFGKVAQLFGPLSEPDRFFFQIRSILQKEWFYNDLTKEQAYNSLLGTQPGTFLVRLSSNANHLAVVSLMLPASYEQFGILHIIIALEPGVGFYLQVSIDPSSTAVCPRFRTIEELIEYYKKVGPLTAACRIDWHQLCTQYNWHAVYDNPFASFGDAYLSSINQLTENFQRLLSSTPTQSLDSKRSLHGTVFDNNRITIPEWMARVAAVGTVLTPEALAVCQQRFIECCAAGDLEQRDVPDDYLCLFAAVSDQLFGVLDQASQLHLRALDWLQYNSDFPCCGVPLHSFIPGGAAGWRAYVDQQRTLGTWSDGISLIAVSQVFQMRLLLLSYTDRQATVEFCPINASSSAVAKTILLGHFGDLHFCSLKPTHADTKTSKKRGVE